ncbi:methylenetetrahydrofolate reductase [Pseudoruegeria sp. HB172150]|uniref:methylenetetrahydrofolate reductase n=1 Tax=Pseudoruegeria sp. HB172150 TaxID=2721164 RepID=UPI001553BD54|nr:methylenetetrahydrofolate reductase [Pseudoruegeria sp. HB172150]
MISFIGRKAQDGTPTGAGLQDLLKGYSIEVMPRTAAKVEDFKALLPEGTRVYIAHIEGTPIEDMVETAKRISGEGFPVMPHFPARIIEDRATLEDWIKRYQGEAGVDQALLLAGGVANPVGDFHSSMQLMETGLFDSHGFKRLHVAGHPEGNKDIDADGTTKLVDEAAQWKQAFSERTDAEMAMATQFAFEAQPILDWIKGMRDAGISLPVHLGIAGPAKLQTMIKFAIACGVGPSLKVLQKRAKDVTKLVMPYEPTEILTDLAEARALNGPSVAQIHFFPLGGIKTCAEYAIRHGAVPVQAAA